MEKSTFFAPRKIDEALAYLTEYGAHATILAGGTDIVPKINYYDTRPDSLLYTGRMGMDDIREEGGALVIGAGVTWNRLIESGRVAGRVPVLAEAARNGSCDAIRNTATIGGNLANASPAADLSVALMALDVQIVIQSAAGKRVVAVDKFFTGPGTTVLDIDEMLTDIRLPERPGRCEFFKLGRRKAMTCSVVNTAAYFEMDGETCRQARIALGAMAPTPIRCTEAEDILIGRQLNPELINRSAAAAVDAARPIDDIRATAWYRQKAGKSVVARTMARAAGMVELFQKENRS